MTDSPIDILALTSDQFAISAAAHGVARPMALSIYRDVFRNNITPEQHWITLPSQQVLTTRREGETTKFTQQVDGGLETESVILPQTSRTGRPRVSLCVSSQVGCAMGCSFCETATMGLLRNLTVSQIISQWRAARFQFDAPISNIVFMGMGEPMHNPEAVVQAIRVLTDANGPAIAPGRISVSTVGRAAGIRKLAQLVSEPGFHKLRLAVSVNAPNDAIRSQIMPVNKSTPMAELMDAMLAWPGRDALRILIEYVLIPGVNDQMSHADELCRYLKPLSCTVNVIPYNPIRNSPWPAPDEAHVQRFIARIMANGQLVKRRQTLGRTLMAACGQLGNADLRRKNLKQCSGQSSLRTHSTSTSRASDSVNPPAPCQKAQVVQERDTNGNPAPYGMSFPRQQS